MKKLLSLVCTIVLVFSVFPLSALADSTNSVEITTQPESVIAGVKSPVTWTIVARGSGLTYQWQYLEKGKTVWSNFSKETSTSLTKTVPESWDGWSIRCVVKDSSGNTVNSDTATIIINKNLGVSKHPQNVSVKAGTRTIWDIIATGTGMTYQWQYLVKDTKTWTNFSGETSVTLVKNVPATWDGWKIRCAVKASSSTVYSNEALITIVSDEEPEIETTPINIIDHPKSVVVGTKAETTWTISATGEGLTYQWQYSSDNGANWSNFSKETSTSLTKTVPETWNGWKIRCVVKDLYNKSAISNEASITVETDFKIIAHPASYMGEAGLTNEWSVIATGIELSYQWQYLESGKLVWANFSGATKSTLSKKIPASWNGWKVRCVINDKSGHKLTSNEVGITIRSNSETDEEQGAIVITKQPISMIIAPKTSVTWSIAANGDGLTYQWQYLEKGKTTWANFTKETSTSLNRIVPAGWDEWKIRCVIKDINGNTKISDEATISVKETFLITEQPHDYNGQSGLSNTWSIIVSGTSPTYQWQYLENGKTVWANFGNETKNTLTRTIPEKWNGWKIRCIVTDNSGKKLTSNEVSIIINNDVQPEPISSPITIITQPESVLVAAKTKVTWSIYATGLGLTYQWQYLESNTSTWANFSKETSTSLVRNVPASWDGWKIRCIVKDTDRNQIVSSEASITIGETLQITSQPTNYIGASGKNNTWTLFATGDGLTYQWQYMETGRTQWANFVKETSNELTRKIPESWNGWKIRCVVSDSAKNTVYSEIVTISITSPIEIINQPTSKIANIGDAVSFEISVIGANSIFDWQTSTDNTTWTSTGASTSTYTFTANESLYVRCIVTSGTQSVTSEVATLTVTIPVTSITLTNSTLSLAPTETATLVPTILPENATDKTVTWSTSDSSVATVENGLVTAVSAGTATITVTASNNLTAQCDVTVDEPAPTFSWSFDRLTGVLSVSGSMPNFASVEETPWYSIRDSILSVEFLGEHVEIGNNAFEGLNISSVDLTNVERIGDGAFRNCNNIQGDVQATNVTWIGDAAFENCSDITSVYIGDNITVIGDFAFDNCSNLTTFTILDNSNIIGDFTISGVNDQISIIIGEDVYITPDDGEPIDSIIISADENGEVQVVSGDTPVVMPPVGSVAESVYITGSNSVRAEESITLSATLLPANAVNRGYTWSSSDTTVATASELDIYGNAQVTGVAEGTAVITVVNKNNQVTASVTITVEPECEHTNTTASYSGNLQHVYICDVCGKTVGQAEACIDTNGDSLCDICGHNMLETYTVTYDANGGVFANSEATITVSGISGEYTIASDEPEREGFTFTGWKIGDVSVSGTITVNSNVTLMAQWQSNTPTVTYTVTYDANGGQFGTGLGERTVSAPAGTYTLSGETPIWEGYTFQGWSLGDGAVIEIEVSEDVRVFAAWTPNEPQPMTYTVTYDAGEGEFSDGEHIKTETGSGTYTLIDETPTLDGMVFEGWLNENDAPVGPDIELTGNITLTARYSPIPVTEFTVTFNANGGYFYGDENNSQTLVVEGISGEYVIDAETPIYESHTFIGWATDPDSTETVNSITVAENTTLYAVWEENEIIYTITYHGNGGLFDGEDETYEEQTPYGMNYSVEANRLPERGGYTFVAWGDLNGVQLEDDNFVPTGDMDLYAIWEEDELQSTAYTVTYYANGGAFPGGATSMSGVLTDDYIQENGSYVGDLGDNGWVATPEREGYEFRGWSEDPDWVEGDMAYDDGSLNSDHYPDGMAITGDVSLYACWVAEEPEILTDLASDYYPGTGDGFEVEAEGIDLHYRWQYKMPGYDWTDVPNNDSNTWNPSLNASHDGMQVRCIITDEGYNPATTTTSSVATFHWTGFTVTYSANGGLFEENETTLVESGIRGSYTLTATQPTKENSFFQGWADENGNAVSGTITVEEDTTLYAVWQDFYFITQPEDTSMYTWTAHTITARTNINGARYQWYTSGDNGATWTEDQTGMEYEVYRPSTAETLLVKCTATYNGLTITSNVVTLTITPVPTFTVYGVYGEDQYTVGDNISLYVEVSIQEGVTVSWEKQGNYGWVDLEGTTQLTDGIREPNRYLIDIGPATLDMNGLQIHAYVQRELSGLMDPWDGYFTLNVIAVPEPVSYTVTYYANGGAFPGGATNMSGVLTDDYIQENGSYVGDLGDNGWVATPEREGYEFRGWSEDPDWVEGDMAYDDGSLNSDHYPDGMAITGDVSLYACWVAEEPQRTLSVTMDDVTQSAGMGAAFFAAASWSDGTEVTGAGYRWYTLNDGNWVEISGTNGLTTYYFATTIDMSGNRYKVVVTCDGQEASAEATLTVGYRVLYDAYYGEFPGDVGRYINIIVTEDQGGVFVGDLGNGNSVPEPTREGYEFGGWYDASFQVEYEMGSWIEVNDNIILYAYWPEDEPEPEELTVNIWANSEYLTIYDVNPENSDNLTIWSDVQGGIGDLTYQWQQKTPGYDEFVDAWSMGDDEGTFYMEGISVEDGTTYRLVVNGVPSNEIMINVYHEYPQDVCPDCGGVNGEHYEWCPLMSGGPVDPDPDNPEPEGEPPMTMMSVRSVGLRSMAAQQGETTEGAEEEQQPQQTTRVAIQADQTTFSVNSTNPDEAGYLYIFGAVEGADGEYVWQESADGQNWNKVNTVSDNPAIFQYPVSGLSGIVFYRLTVNDVVSNIIKVTVEWYEPEVPEEQPAGQQQEQPAEQQQDQKQELPVDKQQDQQTVVEDFTSGDDQLGGDDFTSDQQGGDADQGADQQVGDTDQGSNEGDNGLTIEYEEPPQVLIDIDVESPDLELPEGEPEFTSGE